MAIFHNWIVVRTNTPFYVHIEAELSMVDLASLICFTKNLCKNILTLTKPRANAQLVVKSVCSTYCALLLLPHPALSPSMPPVPDKQFCSSMFLDTYRIQNWSLCTHEFRGQWTNQCTGQSNVLVFSTSIKQLWDVQSFERVRVKPKFNGIRLLYS